MTTQLASAAEIRVISISGSKNFDFCRQCGASDFFDYKDTNMVDDVVKAVGHDTFVGIFNSISTEDSFKLTIAILEKLGGGKIATSQPPPESLPDNVVAAMMHGEGEHSAPLWDYFVTKGLESGKLKCLPEPFVVGKGLESLQEAMDKLKAGVSAQKIVVEL
jgi:NADPH:quinone reductase-like Zn-dependent oxidoreductase